ncbi:sugar ABC transporter substrate-binding protein [Streptomyces sp. SID13666]|nr:MULTISPECIES: substrate-binding domain-containing protein [Streptomyces]NEA54780.1 sugar ABC transporter substrate-binding protein [Streptomyces sp. SID13666]NEA70570.1 sugar ABC transporter substrate-binding protein [Streptomyces sp. SID13588]QNA78534.1 sugar ABC transporter substrate-binding protein [Streptomyces sp. So13.3]
MRRAVMCSLAVTMTVSAAACGDTGDTGVSLKDKSIGLLLPDNATKRYEKFDRPLIGGKITSLCPDCKIAYENADGDPARQAQQVRDMIAQGVKVLILSPQDAVGIKASVQEAVDKGVKVVAYDRFAQGPVSAYVSYDNEKVGELQGQALLNAMGDKATPTANVVMINGDDADPNAAQFKAGAHKALDGKVKIAYEQSGKWKDTVANQKVTEAIARLGAKNIDGVYSANDGMAGGIATALKDAGINVPLTGQDADLAGIQRILAGKQSSTVYKAFKPEADATAEIAVKLINGEDIKTVADTVATSGSGTTVPAKLLTAVSVTKDNIKDTVVKDEVYLMMQICAGAYAAACEAAGIR